MRFVANAISIIFLITFIGACKDDDPTLPPITSSGANTFGCLIDGKVAVQQESLPSVDPGSDMIVVYASTPDATFVLIARDTTHTLVANQPYYFKAGRESRFRYTTTSGKICIYEDPPISGAITFSKIDYESHVISGVFEFTGYSTDCNKSVTVTEGRFDIRTDM